MKTIVLLALTLFSVTASANNFDRLSDWLKQISARLVATRPTFNGHIANSVQFCQLSATRNPDDSVYIALGVGDSLDTNPQSFKNHFFGGTLGPASNFRFREARIEFVQTNMVYGEGSETHHNVQVSLKVELDSKGKPLRATGWSSIQKNTQVCVFTDTTF